MPKSPRKQPAPPEEKSSSGKSNRDEASIRAGQEVMCETLRQLKKWEAKRKRSLGYERGFDKLDQLLEASKPIACNVISKSGKTKGQQDADSLTTDFVEVPDNQVQIKATDMLFSLLDAYPDKKIKGNLTVNLDGKLAAIAAKVFNANRRG